MARRMPPTNALRAFEAAVRNGSYTAAASELGVTHGAISKQIQSLSEWFGQDLFYRSGHRMVPTTRSRDYAAEIGDALDRLSDASERFEAEHSSSILYVAAPATFAMRWLIPRLQSFHSKHPSIEVRITTTSAIDMGKGPRGPFDLIIYRTAIDDDEHNTVRFLIEHSTVLASPQLLKKRPLREVADLSDHIALISDSRGGEWEEWLAVAGIRGPVQSRRYRFNHYFVTLQAAIDGIGVMVGPMPILADDVEQGRLAIPFPDVQAIPRCYLARFARDARNSPPTETFLSWLVSEGQASMKTHAITNLPT